VKTSFGYPDVDGEMALLDRRANRRTLSPSVEPVVDRARVVELQDLAEDVRVDEKVRRYIVDVARATRADDRVDVGVSPRGVQRVFEAARAAALVAGRRYVTPDDVKRLAETTMAHRLVLTTQATVEGVQPGDVIRDALDSLDVPAVSPDANECADADDSAGDVDSTELVPERPDSDGPAETDGSPGGARNRSPTVGPRSTDGAGCNSVSAVLCRWLVQPPFVLDNRHTPNVVATGTMTSGATTDSVFRPLLPSPVQLRGSSWTYPTPRR